MGIRHNQQLSHTWLIIAQQAYSMITVLDQQYTALL